MKKAVYFIPVVLAILLYIILGFIGSFSAIHPLVYFWIAVMFLSSLFMFKNKWYGCIGGLLVGFVVIFMSTQYTGQVIDIERPLGAFLCIYYLTCGIVVYNKSKR